MNNFFKKYGVYINFDRTTFSSFRLRLELSLCMRASLSSNMNGKLSKWKTNVQKYQKLNLFDTKIFKMFFNLNLKISCALPPYYSLELDPISSTSHSNLSRGPGSRFTWFAASAKRKLIFKLKKLMNYDIFACFSRFCHFLNFGWFWDGFTMNFESLARFPARGWFQINPGLKFHSK